MSTRRCATKGKTVGESQVTPALGAVQVSPGDFPLARAAFAASVTRPLGSVGTPFIFLWIVSGSSSSERYDFAGSLFDIFLVGSVSDMILGVSLSSAFASGKVGPKRLLKLRAMTRVVSTCWIWSWPTGTASPP